MKKLDFCGKTVVVSGASSGIGKAIASYLIKKHDARVIGLARGFERLQAVRAELGEKFVPYSLDVTSKDGWGELFSYLVNNRIEVSALINCAGALPEFKAFDKTQIEELEEIMKLNFLSCAYAYKAIEPILEGGAAVVNVSSASALCPFGGVSTYTATKSALDAFTASISCERKDIRISSVLPGFVRTDIMKNQQISKKEARLIRSFSADAGKVARKIVRRVSKRKRRILVGKDARALDLVWRVFPKAAPRLVTWFLKKSGLELFSKI